MEEEIIYKTGYALLSAKDYKALNEAISKAMGFPDNITETFIYAPIEPVLDTEGNCVMEIDSYIQSKCNDLLKDIKLVDTYSKVILEC